MSVPHHLLMILYNYTYSSVPFPLILSATHCSIGYFIRWLDMVCGTTISFFTIDLGASSHPLEVLTFPKYLRNNSSVN